MARGNPAVVIKRASFTNETVTFVVKQFKYHDFGLQWVKHSGGGSAAINIKGTLSADKKLIAAADSTDRRWAIIDLAVFPNLPGGGRDSNILPFSDNSLTAIIVDVVITGTIELEMLHNTQSRGT